MGKLLTLELLDTRRRQLRGSCPYSFIGPVKVESLIKDACAIILLHSVQPRALTTCCLFSSLQLFDCRMCCDQITISISTHVS